MNLSTLRFGYLLFALYTLPWLSLAPRAQGQGSDSFAGAYVFSGYFYISPLTSMNNFTKESGEPNHGFNYGHSAWWRWTAPSNGFCTVETLPTGGLVDTVLSVYTGTNFANLVRVAAGDNVLGTLNSSVTFYATAGSVYYVAVDASALIGSVAEAILRLRQVPRGAHHFVNTWQAPTQNTAPSANGRFVIDVTATGAASGYVVAGIKRYSFVTQATIDGYLHVTIPRTVPAGSPPLPPFSIDVDLALEGASGLGFGFTFSDGVAVHGVGSLEPIRKFTTASPAPNAGKYNCVMAPTTGTGSGFARIAIKAGGQVTLAGVTGDGKTLSMGSRINTNGQIPFHQGFSGGNGFFNGYVLSVVGAPNYLTTPSQRLRYRRAAKTGSFYPAGLVNFPIVEGRPYQPPAPGQRALGFLDASNGAGKLTTIDAPGELAAFSENLTFTKANAFRFASSTRHPRLTIDPATGLVSGGLDEPAGIARRLRGILGNFNGPFGVRGMVSGGTRTAPFEVNP